MAVWSESACTQKPVPAAITRPWGFPSGSIVALPVVRRYKPASALYWKSAPCESSQEPPTNGSWAVVPGWLVVGSSRIRTAPLPVEKSLLLSSSYQIAWPSEAIVGPDEVQAIGIVP